MCALLVNLTQPTLPSSIYLRSKTTGVVCPNVRTFPKKVLKITAVFEYQKPCKVAPQTTGRYRVDLDHQ